MDTWITCRTGSCSYWLTRIAHMPNGCDDYVCGSCGGPLLDHVAALFESSRGSPGVVTCTICGTCDAVLLGQELPAGMLDQEIERALSAPVAAITQAAGGTVDTVSSRQGDEEPVRLRSGVQLPAGATVLRAQIGLTGPDLPPGSRFVGIRVELPYGANVVPLKRRTRNPAQ